MACPSQEQRMVRFIKELSEVSHRILVKEVKPIDAVLLLIERVIVCFIHFLVERLDMIAFFLLSTLLLI